MADFTLLYVYSLQPGWKRVFAELKGPRGRRGCLAEEAVGGGSHSTVRFYEIKGHIVTGITSIRKRRIQASRRTWN